MTFYMLLLVIKREIKRYKCLEGRVTKVHCKVSWDPYS